MSQPAAEPTWTYKALLAYAIRYGFGGRMVLDSEALADLARHKVRDEWADGELVLTSKRMPGPL